MLVPGMTIVADRVLVTVAGDIVPAYFKDGFGFTSGGRLCIDSAAPAGSNYQSGIRRSANGAIYGVTSGDLQTDIWLAGLRFVLLDGRLVYADAASSGYVNGNPITSDFRLAVNTA